MSLSIEASAGRHAVYPVDAEASVHDLLNDATEWLQYARGITGLLADLIHESDSVDCRQMALGLEAIGALHKWGCDAQRRRTRACAGRRHVPGQGPRLTTPDLAATMCRGRVLTERCCSRTWPDQMTQRISACAI